jgi:hypothetical protein
VQSLWTLPLERHLAKGLDDAEALRAMTDGQRTVRLLLVAQGAIDNGGVSHLYDPAPVDAQLTFPAAS